MVDPRASTRAVTANGDQEAIGFVKDERGKETPRRRFLEFDEDITEIIEEVVTPSQAAKGVTPP